MNRYISLTQVCHILGCRLSSLNNTLKTGHVMVYKHNGKRHIDVRNIDKLKSIHNLRIKSKITVKMISLMWDDLLYKLIFISEGIE